MGTVCKKNIYSKKQQPNFPWFKDLSMKTILITNNQNLAHWLFDITTLAKSGYLIKPLGSLLIDKMPRASGLSTWPAHTRVQCLQRWPKKILLMSSLMQCP